MDGTNKEDKSSHQSPELITYIDTTTVTTEQIPEKARESLITKLGEVVCIGATIMIAILLICVLIYYEVKDHDV